MKVPTGLVWERPLLSLQMAFLDLLRQKEKAFILSVIWLMRVPLWPNYLPWIPPYILMSIDEVSVRALSAQPIGGWRDSSIGKVLTTDSWNPECYPQYPHKREISINLSFSSHTHTHTHTHTQSMCPREQIWKARKPSLYHYPPPDLPVLMACENPVTMEAATVAASSYLVLKGR